MSEFLQGILFTISVVIVVICIYLLFMFYILMTMDAGSPLTQWRDYRENKRLCKRKADEDK